MIAGLFLVVLPGPGLVVLAMWRDGAIVGSIRSGAWGHRLGRSIGMGYVSCDEGVAADWLASGRWEVEVACRRHPCRVQLQPWYDPRNERIRS